MSEFQFNTIDEILEDLRDGKIVVMSMMKIARTKGM